MNKQLLFSELVKRRPFQGPKKIWCDKVMSGLHALGVTDDWYCIAGFGKSCALLLLMSWLIIEGLLLHFFLLTDFLL